MFNKLKQIKDLRNKAKTLQNELATETATGSAAWGKVKIKMDGNQKIQSVEIDPEFLNSNQKKQLENAIKEAFEDAIKKIQRIMVNKMKNMPGGLDIPGLN